MERNTIMDRTRPLILGYGEMGHALERLLAARHRPLIWQRTTPSSLETLAADSDLLLFCLPATAHPAIAARLAPLLSPDALCLTIAKGLDENGHLPAEAMSEALGSDRVAVLYGPMIAEEILTRRQAFAECAAPTPEAQTRITALFRGSALRVDASQDRTGLSWSAVLKNVYAMAFGMADELALGDNVRGFLTVAALDELSRLVRQLGGKTETPYRIAGLGDLITTATSAGSHHHALGRKLARGERNLSGEGIHTLKVLRRHPRFDNDGFPLFRLIDECAHEPQDVRRLLITLLHSAL